MLELDVQIQAFIDSGAAPVTADEAMTRIGRPDDEAGNRQSTRSHRRLAVYVAVVAIAAVVITAVGLVLPGGRHNFGVTPASAAAVLDGAAEQAQAQQPLVPGPGQFLYVRTLVSMTNGTATTSGATVTYYVQELKQIGRAHV